MVYQYVAYNESGGLVKGKLSAATEEAATELLSYAGYKTVSLKPYVPFFNVDKLLGPSKVKTTEIMLLYRQLALLIESGTSIGASLGLLQQQVTNRTLKKVLAEITSEVRGGTQLSTALSKHPKIFAPMYVRLLGVGEQTGNLETILRQVADYMEKAATTGKETKSALTMPIITFVAAILVVGLMIVVVLPQFGKLYGSMGAKLPPMAKALIGLGEGAQKYGLYIALALLVIGVLAVLYIKTPRGRYKLDQLLLRLPLVGRVNHLSELSRYCRSMALLFRSGLPLTEAMPMAIDACGNKVVAAALADVKEDMVKGEGLSRPMAKNKIFLPMMVQMISVGEETGNLDTTLQAVAQSYETEAEDRMHSLIQLIQPAMTLGLGLVIGVIAVTLFSTIYGMSEGM